MKTGIKELIKSNPSGLLELQPSITISEYRENFGFNLKNTHTIYKSKKHTNTDKDWFAFSPKPLSNLFEVKEESDGDLLIVYIAEVIKSGNVYCYLILSDEAFNKILNDKSQHVLNVHQMYTQFFRDYIAMNKESAKE